MDEDEGARARDTKPLFLPKATLKAKMASRMIARIFIISFSYEILKKVLCVFNHLQKPRCFIVLNNAFSNAKAVIG